MSRKPFFIHFMGLTYGSYLKIHYKIKTAGFENIPKEGPYLVLSNHTHLLDSFFISAVMNSHIRWIAGAYLFKNQILKILLTKLVGSIGKQQGRSDLTTISNVKEAFRKGENVGLFPEGTRTWDGEPLGFSVATAKFVRLFNVPVVLMNLEGNYALKPRWAQKARKGPFTIRVVDVLKPKEIKELTLQELYELLDEKLGFSFAKWQQLNKKRYVGKRKAEKIERLLYLCPSCNGRSTIHSHKNSLFCSDCSLKATLDEYENLIFNEKQTVNSVSEWNQWQKQYLSTIEDEKVFPDDKGVLLQRGIEGKLLTLSKNFSLSLEKERLVVSFSKRVTTGILKGFETLSFEFSKMESMIINAKGTVEFFNDGQLWRIRIEGSKSILKYVEWYENCYKNQQEVL